MLFTTIPLCPCFQTRLPRGERKLALEDSACLQRLDNGHCITTEIHCAIYLQAKSVKILKAQTLLLILERYNIPCSQMIPSKNTDKSSVPHRNAPRASGNFPCTTYAIILWPSEQDETVLKILLRKYRSKILRALLLTKEEFEKFEILRLDHVWKDSNARYSEKDYPPPEFYASWNQSSHAAVPNPLILKNPIQKKKAFIPEVGAENAKTVKIEDRDIKFAMPKGIQIQTPLAPPRRPPHTNELLPHLDHRTLEDIEHEIHLLLITSKQRPGRAHQVVDLQQPIDFDEALEYLESLNIPGGVGRVRSVGVISESPSSVYSEWEDEEDEEAVTAEARGRRTKGGPGMMRKDFKAVPKATTIGFARGKHAEHLNVESRLLNKKSGNELFSKKNDQEHRAGSRYVRRGFWEEQEEEKDDDEADDPDKGTRPKRFFSRSSIPMPIPSGRPRSPETRRTTKRKAERPPARPPKPKVPSKKLAIAAVNYVQEPPNANFPGLDDVETSEAPESSRSRVSHNTTFTNWVSLIDTMNE